MVKELTVIGENESSVMSAFKKTASIPHKQIEYVAKAFQMGAYDMTAEYVWKKAIVRLKDVILSLGEDLVYNLLQRPNDTTSLENLLTEFNIIKLSEAIGLIDKKAALKLRHDAEIIQYTFSTDQDNEEGSQEGEGELRQDEALGIIIDCAQYVLNVQKIRVTIEFDELRDKMLNDDIKRSDSITSEIKSASLFYIRTIFTVIITAIRNDEGAPLEHSLNNLKVLLPLVWTKLTREDKFKFGFLYRDVAAAGKDKAVLGVKSVLSMVHGFDYVPESLRSDTFIELANNLIDTHFDYNNFYNEPKPTKELANLGTYIPDPAFGPCIKAYILVYIGNFYGESHEAAPIAKDQLLALPQEKWELYFNEILPNDEDVLWELRNNRPINRFCNLIKQDDFQSHSISLSREGRKIFSAIQNEDTKFFYEYVEKMNKN